ncbi:MAG: ROK family protein [Candidatus Auribacterota bacterium]
MNDVYVGLDFGATKIYCVLAGKDGTVLTRSKVKTAKEADLDVIGKQLFDITNQALASMSLRMEDVSGIGIAVPSPVDHENGYIVHAPNFGAVNVPAKSTFEKIFGREVFLGNDANCGILAEHRFGAAKGSKSAVGFFVGTGVGGGIILDGTLYTSKKGVAGDLGHMIIKAGGRTCGCGNKGCLEAYSSKTAFGKRLNKLINERHKKSSISKVYNNDFSALKSSDLAKAYKNNDEVVCGVLRKGAYMLGLASANIITVLEPDCFVYGGGVMEALGNELFPYIRQGLEENLFGLKPGEVNIYLSSLGDDAVALGAAILPVYKIKA